MYRPDFRRKRHEHLYMLLLAVGLTAARAYLLVCVVNCWTNCSRPERCRSSYHRSQKIREYDACLTRSSLATDSTAGHVQNSCSGVQVPARHMAPLYLREYCQPLSSVVSRHRQSEHSGRLAVPRTRTNYGDRSFAVQGLRTWNSLPADLQVPDISVETFRHKLNTSLFAVWLSTQRISCITRFCAI